ncbi:hypothetical protein DB30_01272 [Enhygromyxa salina]|uniref:Uncharacterized protein n=1 Tax=Enhygromyxa salina TaxID=215803 RepID=A0A0C2CXK6_9BACT|nr:hypothetical protein [Enhygromyxa salina]KIG12562.1 hypothetical protein DB30_01272 [Enhygromyxa salina]
MMSTRAHAHLQRVSLAASLAALAIGGCKDPVTKDPSSIDCTQLEGGEQETGECESTNATAGDETGTLETGGLETDTGETGDGTPKQMASDECHHNLSGPGDIGIQYQCAGELHARLDFSVGGKSCADLLGAGWCEQSNYFDENIQPYAAAEVIACCGKFDYQHTDVYKRYCAYDMYQQLCITLAERLQAGVNDGSFGIFAKKVAPIQVWIAQNYKECFDSLLNNNSAKLPQVVSHWTLGDFGDVTGVVVSVTTPTKIDGVSLPKDESEWISCTNAQGNNDQIFEDGHTPNGGIFVGVDLAVPLDADLAGPSILGGAVTAAASFDAVCGPRGCPAAAFSYDANGTGFTLEEFDVFEDDAVVITNGVASLVAERVQVRLWKQALGYKVIEPTTGHVLGYEIPEGAAQFVVSGVDAAEGSNRFMAINSTDIWLTREPSAWSIDSFDVEFEDGSGSSWTLTFGDSRWVD